MTAEKIPPIDTAKPYLGLDPKAGVFQKLKIAGKKTKSRKEAGQSFPIEAAMSNLHSIRKQSAILPKAMSLQNDHTVQKGMEQPLDGRFKSVFATHFGHNARLTSLCDRAEQFDQDVHTPSGLDFEVRVVKVSNKTDGSAPADAWSYNSFPKEVAPLDEKLSLLIPASILKTRADLATELRYTSMILANNLPAENNLLAYRKHLKAAFERFLFKKSNDKLDEPLSETQKNTLIQNILDSTQKDTVFIYNRDPDIRTFHARDYVINLCQIKGFYNFQQMIGGVLKKRKLIIERKMVLASLNSNITGISPGGLCIPVCEELVVQIATEVDQKLVYEENGCIISAKLKLISAPLEDGSGATLSPTAPASRNSQWHFFGNNAFTLHHSSDLNLCANPRESAMFMAGVIIRRLLDVNDGNADHGNGAVNFFGGLFADKARRGGTSLDRGAALTTRVLKRLYTAHTNNISEDRPQDEANFNASIHDRDILQKSFLSNQHASDLTLIADNDCYYTKQCFATFSFCVVVLSPVKNPAINAVFVGNLDMSSLVRGDKTDVELAVIDQTPTSKKPSPEFEDGGRESVTADTKAPPPSIFPPNNVESEAEQSEDDKDENLLFHDDAKYHPVDKSSDVFPISDRTKKASKFPQSYRSSLPPDLELELELL